MLNWVHDRGGKRGTKIANDCVCRALTIATEDSPTSDDYQLMAMMLRTFGAKSPKARVNANVFVKVANRLGLRPTGIHHGETLTEVAKSYPNCLVICNEVRHITAIKNGDLHDAWDCRHWEGAETTAMQIWVRK